MRQSRTTWLRLLTYVPLTPNQESEEFPFLNMDQKKSWTEYLSQMAPIAAIVFFILRLNQPNAVSQVARDAHQSIPSNEPVISPALAAKLTRDRIAAAESQRNATRATLGMVLGSLNSSLAPSVDEYVLPVYPTHSEENIPLGNHISLLSAKNWPEEISLSLYFTSNQTFSLETLETATPAMHIPRIIPSWKVASETTNISVLFSLKEYFGSNLTQAFPDESLNIYCHAIVAQTTTDTHPATDKFDVVTRTSWSIKSQIVLVQKRFSMMIYKHVKAKPAKRNLLNQSDVIEETAKTDSREVLAYFKPTLDLSFVLDIPTFPRNKLSAEIAKYIDFSDEGYYLPQLYWNDFWITSKKLIQVNTTEGNYLFPIFYFIASSRVATGTTAFDMAFCF